MDGIALTFDDGPDSVWTPRLLDRLAAAGAQATFFPISERVQRCPAVFERILAEGHAVGLHCREHVRHRTRDVSWLRRDTGAALATLAEHGANPRLWRPPWGDSAPWTGTVAAEYGLTLMGWDVDTQDWRGDGAAEMFAATREGLVGGAVVLAHDGIGPGARRRTPAETLEYTELTIDYARARNVALCSLTVETSA